MYLGIDIGTSAVKAVLVNEDGVAEAEGNGELSVRRPHDLWSEQDPQSWWDAVLEAVAELKERAPTALSAVKGVGLSGQMHGATLLDASGQVLRPAILWNDGRSASECAAIEEAAPNSREITGNVAMPGFTAPKLAWVRNHEPKVFGATAKVLLPKDYVRLRMTGDYASDLSDSAGTLWLDVARRDWSDTMLEACGLNASHMPILYDGTEATGVLRAEAAEAWGIGRVPVAGGGGDNAAGAAGVGVVQPGQAFLSLGTSGVYFVACDSYAPNPEGGVHTFCHCLHGAWHQMSVILSAASCLTWATRLTGAASEGDLVDEIEAVTKDGDAANHVPLFLPYLSGERTPHNDPAAKGVFFGLTHETSRADLGRAVLEGVAFAFADGQQALADAGTAIEDVSVIGGGSRSRYWGEIIASVLGRPLNFRTDSALGPAFGAARLARVAVTDESPVAVCAQPELLDTVEPKDSMSDYYTERLDRFRCLYSSLKGDFQRF